jgi:hypothetical protein
VESRPALPLLCHPVILGEPLKHVMNQCVQQKESVSLPIIIPIHTSGAKQYPTHEIMETTLLWSINFIFWFELVPAMNVCFETVDIGAMGTLATTLDLKKKT